MSVKYFHSTQMCTKLKMDEDMLFWYISSHVLYGWTHACTSHRVRKEKFYFVLFREDSESPTRHNTQNFTLKSM